MKLVISVRSQIDTKGAFKNGKLLVSNGEVDFNKYLKSCYTYLDLAYPKYYKMDRLSKLCFLCAEFLLHDCDQFRNYDREQISIVIENYHSSYITDQKHYNSIKERNNYFPSPSVFVYTLPNIMLGELCIRHHINGEASCFLFSKNDKNFLGNYIQSLFDNDNCKCCITGHVDYIDNSYNAELFLIEKKEMVAEHVAKFDKIFKPTKLCRN